MLDTIILTIPINPSIPNPFDGWKVEHKSDGWLRYVKDPINNTGDSFIYWPKVSGIKKSIGQRLIHFLKVEFSAPKLIFGNNLEELEETDFPLVIKTLQSRLQDFGLSYTIEELENAPVSALHPSKNIQLTDGCTASFVISELSKIDASKRFDMPRTTFPNGGKSLQIYTKTHSIVFYDKVSDLSQSKSRALDKDPTKQQLDLYSMVKTDYPNLEIFRIEVRICKKHKLNYLMQKLEFPKNPVFKDVFKKDLCQKIIKLYWSTLVEGNVFTLASSVDPQNLLKTIKRENKGISNKKAIYLVGLRELCRTKGGVRGLRQILEESTTQRNWYRTATDIKIVNSLSKKSPLNGWISQIKDQINSFESYKIR